MNDVLFTADTHFDHARIVELAHRPFADVDEMNEAMIERWNAKVGRGDRVYHLGDFSFGRRERTESFVTRLRGQVHVVCGNHDSGLRRIASRFASFDTYKEIRLGDRRLVLFHYPIASWNGMHHGSWHLHGHSHGNFTGRNGPMQDVGVDVFGFAPIAFDELVPLLEGRELVPVDHHS